MSWRLLGTLDTMILTWFFSGSLSIAAAVGGTEALTKVFLFWAHERVWHRVKWGRHFPSVSSP
ncbi:MAG: DUF2061 domain-containing protein [Nitrospirales bacterium]